MDCERFKNSYIHTYIYIFAYNYKFVGIFILTKNEMGFIFVLNSFRVRELIKTVFSFQIVKKNFNRKECTENL